MVWAATARITALTGEKEQSARYPRTHFSLAPEYGRRVSTAEMAKMMVSDLSMTSTAFLFSNVEPPIFLLRVKLSLNEDYR